MAKPRMVKPRTVMRQPLGQPTMVLIEQLDLRLHDSLYVHYMRMHMELHRLQVKFLPVHVQL